MLTGTLVVDCHTKSILGLKGCVCLEKSEARNLAGHHPNNIFEKYIINFKIEEKEKNQFGSIANVGLGKSSSSSTLSWGARWVRGGQLLSLSLSCVMVFVT